MSHRFGAVIYLGLTFTWSWFFWLLSPVLFHGSDPSASPLFLLGGAGPLIMALLLTSREAPVIRSDFLQRLIDPRRIQGRWWIVVLLLHPLLILAACVLAGAISGSSLQGSSALEHLRAEPLTPFVGGLLTLLFFTFWFGPLPEEVGWRGFVQERITGKAGIHVGSALLGCAWALWHLPLFFIPGTFQHELGIGHARFWVFMLSMVPLSVIMGWVWLHTRRSTLGAALVHFSGNFASVVVVKTFEAALVELLLLTATALFVISGSRR
jgi:membrane protease YdiL (CAAX protease family)